MLRNPDTQMARNPREFRAIWGLCEVIPARSVAIVSSAGDREQTSDKMSAPGERVYPSSARLRVSRPTEPMFSAFVWKALRSKPGRDSRSALICSQSRWPTL